MIAPAIPRWIATQLADADAGVNAQIALVPRGDDEAPPRPVAVWNAYDDNVVARSAPRASLRADEWVLAVAPAEELELAGDPNAAGDLQDSAPVVIHLTGLTVDGQDAATLAEAHRVMRAVRRVILHAFRLTHAEGGLLLEQQDVELPARWKGHCRTVVAGSGEFDLMLVLPLLITDHWALTAPEN